MNSLINYILRNTNNLLMYGKKYSRGNEILKITVKLMKKNQNGKYIQMSNLYKFIGHS